MGSRVARAGLLTAGLLGVLLAFSPAWAEVSRADQLTLRARDLMDRGGYDQARTLLEQALEAAPDHLPAYLNLGFLEELLGNPEAALAAYGEALRLSPADAYARGRVEALFLHGNFPRRFSRALLARAPAPMTVDRVQTLRGTPPRQSPAEATVAYTTGLIYPDAMRTGGPLLRLPLPTGEGDSPYNRVAYGLLAEQPDGELRVRVEVYYPSSLLSEGGRDYAEIAQRLAHWLTRAQGYLVLYLGMELPAEPTRVYLTEAGPPAAESYADSLYFYRIGQPRTPLEWLRQAAHETGHLLLPRMGRFVEPEPWGNGHLGERLLLQWLAQEAELVSGEPWPDPQAQERVAALWGEEQVELADYLAQRSRTLLDTWCQTGPDSPLWAEDTEAALSYLLGFFAWVQAAHDEPLLAATLREATGTNPRDFLRAYQEAVAERLEWGALPLWAGALSLPDSRLTAPPREGALRREGLALGPGDTLALPIYLPAGAWSLSAQPRPLPTALTARLGTASVPVDSFGGLTLHTTVAGWHRLELSLPEGEESYALELFSLSPAPQV